MTLVVSVGPRAFYDHGLGFCGTLERARLAAKERDQPRCVADGGQLPAGTLARRRRGIVLLAAQHGAPQLMPR
jgi:hypothetical protein